MGRELRNNAEYLKKRVEISRKYAIIFLISKRRNRMERFFKLTFTYNISYGIAFGLISYIVISVFCGDAKKIKGSSWVIAALFVAMLLTH